MTRHEAIRLLTESSDGGVCLLGSTATTAAAQVAHRRTLMTFDRLVADGVARRVPRDEAVGTWPEYELLEANP